ncbi:hypothetical protein INT48_007920 [Thamnidium elegans]|uniref:Uncharacterized protein n=1 Tax=Thamnidium elegans TaxID=101142 RepID=A0A8H7SR29_9FUNG|nr:hypothetical protein INT48_007920 [Thamnidium elegans]
MYASIDVVGSPGITRDKATLNEGVPAIYNISKVCALATQTEIEHNELEELERHVQEWLLFLKRHIPANKFDINEHYLSHIAHIIQDMGPFSGFSCRSLERRIGIMKSKIKSRVQSGRNAENIMIAYATEQQLMMLGDEMRTKIVEHLDVSSSRDLDEKYQLNAAGIPYCNITEKSQSDMMKSSVVIDTSFFVCPFGLLNYLNDGIAYFIWPQMRRELVKIDP